MGRLFGTLMRPCSYGKINCSHCRPSIDEPRSITKPLMLPYRVRLKKSMTQLIDPNGSVCILQSRSMIVGKVDRAAIL